MAAIYNLNNCRGGLLIQYSIYSHWRVNSTSGDGQTMRKRSKILYVIIFRVRKRLSSLDSLPYRHRWASLTQNLTS
jgi:hypothetical protein